MKLRFMIVLVILMAAYSLRDYYLPAKISMVYQGEDYITAGDIKFKSTVVLVKHPPLTKKGGKVFWEENKDFLINKYNPIEKSLDRVVFIHDAPEEPYDKHELNYWKGDNQYCFNGRMGDKCISKDKTIFLVTGRDMGEGSEYLGSDKGKSMYIWFLHR